jgi:hypothetical protein
MLCRAFTMVRIGIYVLLLALVGAVTPADADLLGATLEISGGNCRFPDVAYGNVSRQYLVVWAEYSSTVRIWGRLLRGDGSALAPPFPISDAGFASLFPSVAFNRTNNEFLVTWDDGGDRGGVIFGQRVSGSDGALLGGNFAIGSLFGGIRSAVAWSETSANYLVVFWGPGPGNTAAEIYGQRVNASGALLGANFTISNDTVFSGYPAISWAASANQFLVTWDNFDGNILARRVNATTGGLLGGNIVVTTGGGKDRSCVAYDAVNSRWLVQFNEQGNPGYSYDQYAQFVNVDGSLGGNALPLAHTLGFEGDTQFGGDIAFEPGAQRFFASFGTDTGMAGQEARVSGAVLVPQVVLGSGFYTSLNNSADTDAHRFLTAWEGRLGGVYTILGQLWSATLGAPENFSVTSGDAQNALTWRTPGDTHFTGTMIRVKTDSYPTSPTDGALVVDRLGVGNANETFAHSGLANWTTYYYSAFSHDNGPNYSPPAHILATPRPPAVVVSTSDFTNGPDGWTLDVWRAGTSSAFGTVTWDSTAGNIGSTGAGVTNSNDVCTREGSTMTRSIPTTGQTSIQVEYDVMAALFAAPTGTLVGSCAVLEQRSDDQLIVYYSTTGVNGPWTIAQTLTEGVELPTGWTHKFINLAGVPGVANNANFALKFQWQFNTLADSGRVDNVRVLSGAVTGINPALGVTPGSFERTLPAGSAANDILKVSNTGEGGALNFTMSDDAPWLDLTPSSGVTAGLEQAIGVSFNTAPVILGDYSATITIDAPAATNSPRTVPVMLHVVPAAQVWEPFAYYDGDLTTMGGANWTGVATNEMRMEAGVLKISGGSGTVTAQRAATGMGAGGVIAAEMKIRGGGGTGDFFWSVFLDDAAGNNLARWYGGSHHARGRVGSNITPDMILTGEWDDLYVEIDTVANTSAFYFNGVLFGIISHGATAGATVATVRIERNDRPTAAADIVRLDNLSLGVVDSRFPRLGLRRNGDEVIVTWPAVRRAPLLETTPSLAPAAWSAVTEVPIVSGRFQHSSATVPSNRFFRLRKQ